MSKAAEARVDDMSDWHTTTNMLGRLRDFNDRAVWEHFHARFRRPIAAFARRFGLSDAEIDDVIQDTLLAFADGHRQGKYDRTKGRLSHWLFGIAYRQAVNARRQAAQHRELQPDGHTVFWQAIPDEPDAAKAWDSDWEQSSLKECLDQIKAEVSEATYQAFDLIARLGHTPDQAAAKLGMTRDAVYVAKHRVMKRLKQLMRDYEELDGGEQGAGSA